MIVKGIRGAITVEENSYEALKKATLKLLCAMIKKNSINKDKISHVIFTVTDDLNVDFPAKFARLELGWDNIAMMCYNELNVPDSLKMCLRVMIVYNADDGFTPQFVYLDGAQNLRC